MLRICFVDINCECSLIVTIDITDRDLRLKSQTKEVVGDKGMVFNACYCIPFGHQSNGYSCFLCYTPLI